MAGCEMPGLGIEVTFSSAPPTSPGMLARSAPCPLMAAPLGTLETSARLGGARAEGCR